MILDTTILSSIVAVVLISPPVFDPTDSVVRRLRSNGIQLHGRDPFEGTELHGARLPVNTSNDVYAVFLPRRGYSLSDLRSFSRLRSLRNIRSNRELTESQYHALNTSVPANVWFYFNVRMVDGTLVTLGSRRDREPADDTNGDGVINELDGVDLSIAEADPPRIRIGK